MRLSRKTLMTAFGIGCGLVLREWFYEHRAIGLPGRIVLITGGSRGLGFLLAQEFGRQGCRVVICARDEAELERARSDLEAQGTECMTFACDVRDRRQVERMVAAATERFGRIDILVNNAGILEAGPLGAMTATDFQQHMAVMFDGVLNPTLAVLPQMLDRRSGHVVNITSIGGKLPVPHLAAYSCAKYAAVGLSETLHVELARDGVRVVTVVPWLMRTGSFLNGYVKGQREAEFAMFGVLANLPLFTMNAESAARRIVQATRRGEAEVILTPQANVLARLHGLLPGTMTRVLALANRFLPAATPGDTTRARGMELQERLHSSLLNTLMGLGIDSAKRFHQYPGPEPALFPNGHDGHASLN